MGFSFFCIKIIVNSGDFLLPFCVSFYCYTVYLVCPYMCVYDCTVSLFLHAFSWTVCPALFVLMWTLCTLPAVHVVQQLLYGVYTACCTECTEAVVRSVQKLLYRLYIVSCTCCIQSMESCYGVLAFYQLPCISS